MLHIVQSSPTQSHALQDCLLGCTSGDALVLIADGVYGLNCSETQHTTATLYVLAEDAIARGLSAENRGNWIDYAFFIKLAGDHQASINWG